MIRRGSRLQTYAELGRISNLPTCLSNVLVGCAIGAGGGPIAWHTIAGCAAAISLLYLGGAALNDYFDETHDHRERPHRPIPSQRLSSGAVGWFSVFCLFGGAVLLGIVGGSVCYAIGAVLVFTIVLYDSLHKRFPAVSVLMGICRGLVYVAAAAALGWSPSTSTQTVLILAGALTLYTVAITVVAQVEHKDNVGWRRWLALLMPVVVLSAAIVLRPAAWPPVLIAGVVLAVWLARPIRCVFSHPPRTMQAVMNWLSGMCLVDAYFLTLLGQPAFALAAGGCWLTTHWAHRRISGT